jgi:peptide/nickel transport system substrate-binding protein
MSSRNLSDYVARLRTSITSLSKTIHRLRFSNRLNALDEKSLRRAHGKKFPTIQQLKHLPKVLSVAEKKIVRYTSALGVIALILFFYVSLFHDTSLVPKQGGRYTEGLVGAPLYINPILAQTNDVDMDLSRLVFNGLVRYDENYTIIPDLADSWTISEDKKEYTFYIRDGVTWHDGQPFTVNDVFFTYQVIKDKAFKSPLNITFEGVTADITGEDEITFFLEEPYAGFLNVMTVGILPQHLWFDVPSNNSQLAKWNQKPIGTGPFSFKSLTKESNGTIVSYTFEVNKKYHLDIPYLDEMIFKFYPDTVAAVEALKNKNVQGLGFLPKDSISEFTRKNVTLYDLNLSQFTAVFFNKSDNAFLEDAEVRQALTLATNKEQILNEILQGQGNIIHSAVLPGFEGHDESIVDTYNPTQAAEILVADGWALQDVAVNADGTIKEATTQEEGDDEESELQNEIDTLTEQILVKDGNPLTITLTTVQQPDSIRLVEMLQENWERIGVKVFTRIVARAEFATITLPDREYEALAYGGIIGYDADLFPFWHSSQREYPGVNLANYVNRNVDTLIEEVRRLDTQEDQVTKLKEIQSLIKKDIPAIFLYSPSYTYPVSSAVHGITINRLNLPSDRFWTAHQWFVRTKKFFK